MEHETPQKSMQSWRDGKNRLWEIEVELGMQKRIKRMLSHDIFDMENATFHSLMRYDPETAADVLFVAVKPQCDELGIDDIGFAEGCTGQALSDGVLAFYEALTSFFQRSAPTKEKVLRALVLTLDETLTEAGERAVAELRSNEVKDAVSAQLDKATGDLANRLENMSLENSVN